MDQNKWLRRKPQSNLDYLGITLIAVAFYMALLNAQSFLNGVNRILGILAAQGVSLAFPSRSLYMEHTAPKEEEEQ